MKSSSNKSWKKEMQKKTLIMGILNATPDSFSDGGLYNNTEYAVSRAVAMVENGVDIIDIGGESTRPGAEQIGVEEELKRVVPVIQAVANRTDVVISVDTYKAEVARKAVEAGATMINDVWGAKADPEMAGVAAEYNVPIILMHNRENPQYSNLMSELIDDLKRSVHICDKAGVKQENIILDPGIGFAKTYEQNIEVMRNLEMITELGFPVLLGTSRKSIVGLTLNLPVSERVEGTGATVCYGIMKGCQIMRVHDVLEMSRTAKMLDALIGKGLD